MNTDPKSVVMDWTDAVNRHDPDAAAQYFSDNCVFTNVGTGRHAEGRPAVREEFAALLTRWSDVHVETINILINDGRFTKEWTMSGVHSDGLPATGRSFRIRGAGDRTDPRWQDRRADRVLEHGRVPHPGWRHAASRALEHPLTTPHRPSAGRFHLSQQHGKGGRRPPTTAGPARSS